MISEMPPLINTECFDVTMCGL